IGLPGPAEGLAQAADVDVDRALVDIGIAPPDVIEQLLAREHATRPQHEEFEQPIFGRAEVNRLTAPAHAAGLPVEFEVTEGEHGRGFRGIASPEQRCDAGEKLGDRERLYDVVVGSGGEAPYPVGLLAA